MKLPLLFIKYFLMNGFYFLSYFVDRNQKKVYNKNKTKNKTLKIGIFALPNRKEKDI